MNIKNNKNKANYVNFKAGGVNKKILIPAGKTAEIAALVKESQIINSGDFQRGFLEVIKEVEVATAAPAKKVSKKEKKEKKSEDTLEKVKKEVKNYTDNKKNKKNN